MSLIGLLEQLDLAHVLRRIEVFAKTGLLVVKQQHVWVEFYFRQGQLVCTGPVRAQTTLTDRLLQANLLSYEAMPQVMAVIDPSESNETRIALSLINEGYLSREILRAWAAHETSQLLQMVFRWTGGEIHFEEECPTPADRLLVALSISTLLDTLPVATSSHSPTRLPNTGPSRLDDLRATPPQTFAMQATQVTSALSQSGPMGRINTTQLPEATPPFTTPLSPIPDVYQSQTSIPTPGTFNAAQLLDGMPPFATPPVTHQPGTSGMFNATQLLDDDLPFGSNSMPSFAEQARPDTSLFGAELNIAASTQSTLTPPQLVLNPLPPARVDTSFMMPDTILVPVDLSSLREQNPQVQITPDQWGLFTLIDGQTSIHMLCATLRATAEQVCMVAGELMAIGLVTPLTRAANEFQPMPSQQPAWPGAPVAPVPYAAPPMAPTWAPPSGMSGPIPVMTPMSMATQWSGSSTTGANYALSGKWATSAPQGAPQISPAYAPVGGYR